MVLNYVLAHLFYILEAQLSPIRGCPTATMQPVDEKIPLETVEQMVKHII